MKTPMLAAALAAVLLAGSAPAALAQPAPSAADAAWRATTLSLSAYGEVKAAPDLATITLGVTTDAPTAAQAMRDNANRMSRVIASLKAAGIADRDIQTSNLSLNAQYHYEQNQPPRLTGYQASNQVTITVRELNRLGANLDAAVAAGANQVHGIGFGLSDPRRKEAEDAARLQAVQALQAKAELYARATGHRVDRLVSLSEGSSYVPPPRPVPMMMMREQAAAAPTQVEAGELGVRVEVSGLYELAK